MYARTGAVRGGGLDEDKALAGGAVRAGERALGGGEPADGGIQIHGVSARLLEHLVVDVDERPPGVVDVGKVRVGLEREGVVVGVVYLLLVS